MFWSETTRCPVLALTMGDPAGIGPEIIAGAWPALFPAEKSAKSARSRFPESCPVAFGHPDLIRRAAALRKTGAEVIEIDSLDECGTPKWRKAYGPDRIPCLKTCSDDALKVKPGQIDPAGGEAAFTTLNRAIDFALANEIDAIVTGPLHKKSMNLAGHHFPGHTEILANRCGVKDYAMMLYLGPQENLASPNGLAVVHVTLHTAMKNVFRQITKKSVLEKCRLIHDFMSIVTRDVPRIGVCALNCHNGENGLFGDEEIKKIAPAVRAAQKAGLDVEGPFPSDTLMLDAKNGRFDGIVAMIHDQGHIAVKLLGMHKAVNITLGLPIIRTSVAHGTAFDRAWQGVAKTTSLIEAVRIAVLLAERN